MYKFYINFFGYSATGTNDDESKVLREKFIVWFAHLEGWIEIVAKCVTQKGT